MTAFTKHAFAHLEKCKNKIDTEVPKEIRDNVWLGGASPKTWLGKFDTSWKIPDLPEFALNRVELLRLIQPYKAEKQLNSIDVRKLIICIFAWGGMRPTPTWGKSAIHTIESYEYICSELLRGLPSIDAYDEFYKQHQKGMMKGIGPAYYTKLIFFLGDQTGVIMDQWTARSTNLILNAPVIKLTRNKNVDKANCQQVYLKYLDFITELKNTLKIDSLSKTEELIFSCSHIQRTIIKKLGLHHQACSAWRKYVVENT